MSHIDQLNAYYFALWKQWEDWQRTQLWRSMELIPQKNPAVFEIKIQEKQEMHSCHFIREKEVQDNSALNGNRLDAGEQFYQRTPPKLEEKPAFEYQTSAVLVSNLSGITEDERLISLVKLKLQQVHSRPQHSRQQWTSAEDKLLLLLAEQHIPWKSILTKFPNKSHAMIYGRFRRLRTRSKAKWTQEDKEKLIKLVAKYGRDWKQIHEYLPKLTPKQLRQRYENSLNPELNRQSFSYQEDFQIIMHVLKQGKSWKMLATKLKGRSEGWLKGRYYNRLERILNSSQEEIKSRLPF